MNFFSDKLNIAPTNDSLRFLKGSKFSLLNKTTAVLTSDDIKTTASLELMTDFELGGRIKEFVLLPETTNWYGINRQFIDDTGYYDPTLAMNTFSTSSIGKRLIRDSTLLILEKQHTNDSHVMFIYNMLVSWVKAKLYEQSGGTKGIFEVELEPYIDSHVRIPYLTVERTERVEVTLGPPVDDSRFDGLAIHERSEGNYWQSDYVFRYDCASAAGFLFYVYHVLGRNIVTTLNCDVPLPATSLTRMTFERVGGRVHDISGFPDIPWSDEAWIWRHMISYVSENRLQTQFASAYETLMGALVQPRPSSMEATIYWQAPIQIRLPPFAPFRAKIPENLHGEPYEISASTAEFAIEVQRSPSSGLVKAALMNYFMWYGLYAILENSVGGEPQWYEALDTRLSSMQVMSNPDMRSLLVSAISGQDVETSMDLDCFFCIDVSTLSDLRLPMVAEGYDGTYVAGTLIQVPDIPAPVSGALILGCVADVLKTCSHLSANQHFDTRERYGLECYKNILKLSNAYRLFGHDMTIKMPTNELVTPWAPVRELIIEPSSLGYSVDREYAAIVWQSEARKGRSYTLPNILRGGEPRNFSLHILQPSIFIRQYRARTVTAPAIVKPLRRVEPVTFTIKNSRTATFVKKTVPGYGGIIKDFREAGSGLAPRNPDPMRDKAKNVDTVVTDIDVEAVDTSPQAVPGT